MISYEPLKQTLLQRNMHISDLRAHGFHPEVIAKINRNESVTLTQIERICAILDCKVEDVVKIER